MQPAGADASPTWPDRELRWALFATATIGAIVAFCQRGYCNADFVAYAEVAHRLWGEPARAVTGYWAPLFSWLMAPLVRLGVDDLVAGRAVLLVASLGYVVAVDAFVRALVRRHSLPAPLRPAMLAVATVQGSLWAEYLLDPDLLGSTFAYATLAHAASGSRRAFATGALAGLAYLGKSFQLPFLLTAVPILFWLLAVPSRDERLAARMRRWLLRCTGFGLGVAVVAGPWIAVLSRHYGRFLFSTAGPANHANVGPGVRGEDRLWNAPLEADYILSPHLEPDWSPFDSLGAALHQGKLLAVNTGNAAGALLGGPVLLLLLAAWSRRRALPLEPELRRVVRFLCVASLVYVLGYASIQVGRRYLIATVAPLLMLSGLVLVHERMARRAPRQWWWSPIAIALLFTGQEVRLLVVTALLHPQSAPIAPSRALAGELAANGILAQRLASNRYHEGLFVAYAMNRTRDYFGAPRATESAAIASELAAHDIDCFLQFEPATATASGCSLPAPWRLAFTATTTLHDGMRLLVAVRDH